MTDCRNCNREIEGTPTVQMATGFHFCDGVCLHIHSLSHDRHPRHTCRRACYNCGKIVDHNVLEHVVSSKTFCSGQCLVRYVENHKEELRVQNFIFRELK